MIMKKTYKLLCFRGCIALSVLFLTTSSITEHNRKEYPDNDPQKELESFQIADGFEVTLFASEPMVVKPIQMNWDAEGRLWVISSTAYPHLKTGEQANDKVFVLEDTDGDGVADKSTVFAEGLLTPTGILPGDGGVYVANSTEILFLADTDGDGKADVRRKVLSGFGTADTHHLIHTFRWGPEGRLYFNQSIYIHSHVETPWGIRRLEGGGVWKLNPQTLELDVYAHGLINPWGLRFDRFGQSFLTDGAGGEGINYAFPGATFVATPGAERIIRGLNPGQPKHSGLDIVSGRHLPEDWQGDLITNDFRANRINRFKLEEQGSGYASKQMPDLLWTDHVAFRPVDITIGPDGAIYVADWYNPIIQHGEVDFHDPRRDQEHGRIWRITAKNRKLVEKPNLTKATVPQLLEALKAPEEWTRSQARQVLKERGADAVVPELKTWVNELSKTDPSYENWKLEALWVFQALDSYAGNLLGDLLNAQNHKIRAAALRALQLWHSKVDNLEDILKKAVVDTHPQVRLEGVIAARELNNATAARIALDVLDQPMDEFLDFALWQTMRGLESKWMTALKTNPDFLGNALKTTYALKSAAGSEAISKLMDLYRAGNVPTQYKSDVLSAFARRGQLADLNALFDQAINDFTNQNRDVSQELATLVDAAQKRKVLVNKQPERIRDVIAKGNEASAVAAIRLASALNLKSLSTQLTDLTRHENRNYGKAAMAALAQIAPQDAEKLLVDLSGESNPMDLRLAAVAQLASVNPSEAAKIGTRLINKINNPEAAIGVFSAFLADGRRTQAIAEELSVTKIPEPIAVAVRQHLQRVIPWNRRNRDEIKLLVQGLEASGGMLPAEKMPQDLNDDQIRSLASEAAKNGDPARGELVFRKPELACLTCHAIGGAGGLIGPDLSSLGTSSPAETIIKSLIYPTESIKEGYELQRVVRKDGSEMLGYLVSDRPGELIMRDVTGREVPISKDHVEKREQVPGSLMPPGLTASLDKKEFLDLVSFLSKLGETGDFRVPTERYVRRWQAVPTRDELVQKIKKDGLDVVAKDAKIGVEPHYSMVSGALPLNEIPIIEYGDDKKISFVKFQVEVLSPGKAILEFNNSEGITPWVNNTQQKLNNNQLNTEFTRGIQHITLAIDRNIRKLGPLRIGLKEDGAQTRLIMGQ